MSRREARLERAAERKLQNDEKSVRLKARPRPEKKPRIGENPDDIYQMPMTWSCEAPDREGAWSWGTARAWTGETWARNIAPKLAEFEMLKWREIDAFSSGSGHKMHHGMATEEICEEAQYRLIEIDRYEDDIFRFRLGGKRRLWGYRVVANFDIVWFDPDHRIYPVDPD